MTGQLTYPNLSAGRVAAYSAGEQGPGGLVLRDQEGSNHGVITAATWSDQALDFNGSSSRVSVTTEAYKFTTSFSVSTWVKADARVTWARILDYWGSVSTGGWFIGWNSTNQIYEWRLEQIDNGDGSVVSGAITLGQWYHLVGVYDSSANLGILYVDGQEVDRQTTTGTMPSYSSVDELGIGARLNPTSTVSEYFDGQIDDINIYSRALSPQEIATLALRRGIAYELSAKAPPSNLRGQISVPANILGQRSTPSNLRGQISVPANILGAH